MRLRRKKADPVYFGDPKAAVRMINWQGRLRLELGSDEHAVWVTDKNCERWVRIDWEGNVTSGRDHHVDD